MDVLDVCLVPSYCNSGGLHVAFEFVLVMEGIHQANWAIKHLANDDFVGGFITHIFCSWFCFVFRFSMFCGLLFMVLI